MEELKKNYFKFRPHRLKFNSTFKNKIQNSSLNKIKFKPNKKLDNSNNTIKTYTHFGKSIEPIKTENNIRLQTEYSTLHAYKFSLKRKSLKKRAVSVATRKTKLFNEKEKKQFLRGKLRYLVKNNIILCEKKFNPKSFTESISNVHFKEFKNRFKNINTRNKVGIFTNKFPSILNTGNKFYTRYFDYFISPDELLKQNFNKNEIFQIKTDPNYFNFGNNFNYVSFFKKKTLKEILNEEEKIGPNRIMDISLKKSLKQTKKRIGDYLNYYTSVMSRQGFIAS